MPLILYDHPFSPYAQKVKIALMEKGVAYSAPLPTGIGSGTSTDDFAKANPRGEVPALIDGDVTLFDSTIIVEYIEDKWPSPSLMPAAAAARARVRTLEEVMDTHFEGITWGLGEINMFGRAEGTLKSEMLERAAAQLQRWYAWLDRQLGHAQYYGGDRFDRGDLSVIPFVNGALSFGIAPPSGSALSQWITRVNQRPSVKQCNADIRAFQQNAQATQFTNLKDMLERGEFKREYRDHRLEWMIKTGGISVVQEGLKKSNIRFTSEFPA